MTAAPEFETIRYEVLEHTAVITLNRPDRLNSFTKQMNTELQQAWELVGADDDIWVSVLTGAGRRAFCTGTDVDEALAQMTSDDRDAKFKPGRIPAKNVTPTLTSKLNGVYKPAICAVNGMITGGGLHLMADADIVICSSEATFFDSHVSSGHVSSLDAILLTRRIPYTVAMRMALLGNHERLDAKRAYEVGLVTEIVEPGQLRDRALELAALVCRNAPVATRKTVEATWRGLDLGLSQALDFGTLIYMENWNAEDFEEGNRAFVEKRRPQWRNR